MKVGVWRLRRMDKLRKAKNYWSEMENENKEKQVRIQDRGRYHRDFKSRNQFNDNWNFQGSTRYSDAAENQKGGCWKCGSKTHIKVICNQGGQPDRIHAIATMNCAEEKEEVGKQEVIISYCDVQDDQKNNRGI